MEHQDGKVERRCRRVDGGDVECGCYFDRSSVPASTIPAYRRGNAQTRWPNQLSRAIQIPSSVVTSFLPHPPSSHENSIECDPCSTSPRRTDICPAIENLFGIGKSTSPVCQEIIFLHGSGVRLPFVILRSIVLNQALIAAASKIRTYPIQKDFQERV